MKKVIAYIFSISIVLASITLSPYEVSAAKTTAGGYITTALNSGKAVDVNGGYTNDGTKIQLWDFNRSAEQSFRLEKVGGYVKIVHSKSGKVLDVEGGSARNGARVILWSYHGGKNQKWTVSRTSGGYFTFKSALPGNYYLDVKNANTGNGTQIQLYKWNNSKAQKFRIQDDITYTYRTYNLKFSNINSWQKAIKASQQNAMGITSGYTFNSKGERIVNGGIIVGYKILKYKTITVRMQYGQNIGNYVNVKVKLPCKIQYTVHKHHFNRKAYFAVEDVKTVMTCSCGYHDVFSWTIPWPDSSDAQTTQKIIQALPTMQTVPSYAYW